RCHDHKFDPLGQDDYYSLLAFLRNVERYNNADTRLPSGRRTLAVRECGSRPIPTHVLLRGNPATPGKEVAPRFVRVLSPSDSAASPRLPSPPVAARIWEALGLFRSSGRRRVLAEWVASKENPLTARVMANRIWQHHFGRGLVATPNDFGRTGVAPSHP